MSPHARFRASTLGLLFALAACAAPTVPKEPVEKEPPAKKPGSRPRSPSPTPTGTPSPSPSASATVSAKASPTASPSGSPSPKASGSSTPLSTGSASPSAAASGSPGPSASPTTSPTPEPEPTGDYSLKVVQTVAGEIKPPGVLAGDYVRSLSDLVFGPDGTLYALSDYTERLYKVDLKTGGLTVVAGSGDYEGWDPGVVVDGPIASARFKNPRAVTVAADGTIYVAETGIVRRIKDGVIDTIAGLGDSGVVVMEGKGKEVMFSNIGALLMAPDGDLLVGDTYAVRKIDLDAPDFPVTLIAGGASTGAESDGPGKECEFAGISAMCFDPQGRLIVADSGNNAIRRIDMAAADKPVTTIIGGTKGGDDGKGTAAKLATVYGVGFLRTGDLVFSDYGDLEDSFSPRLRKADAEFNVTTFVGGGADTRPSVGQGPDLKLSNLTSLAISKSGRVFFTQHNGFGLIKEVQ